MIKKMRFHITITDNETDITLHDADACAIIAGVNEGEESAILSLSACGLTDLLSALLAAENATKRIKEEVSNFVKED